jgi:S-formylglutathione hydrolase FrmB
LRKRLANVVVISVVAGAVLSGGLEPAGTTANVRTSIGPGHVSVLHIGSADHDIAVRDVDVYRPDVPDSATLPVVYFLHGLPGSASDLFANGAIGLLDHMFETGTPPFVVACPTGTGRAHNDTEWADSVDGRDKLESYIMNRVIATVEGTHRRDAKHRVIAGFSMGGYGAANLALRHPGAFAAAASFAGYFHIDDPDDVFDNRPTVEAANNPGLLIRTVRTVRFFLADGTADREPVVQGEAQRFAKAAGNLIGPHDLVLAPGGHTWAFVVGHLPELAAFVAQIERSG